MSISKREQILSRLMAILETMPATFMGEATTFVTCARNRGELTAEERPAVVLYDGGENVDEAFLAQNKPARATRLVTMSPRIAISLDDREPLNHLAGQDINANVHTITNAIEADAELAALVGPNGSIQYVGILDSELDWNRSLQGEAMFAMAITYVRRHEPPTV